MTYEVPIAALIAMPLIFIWAVAYVDLLLGIARRFSGTPRFVLSLGIYIVSTVVIVALPVYTSGIAGASMAVTMTLSLISISPACYYIFNVRFKELLHAGYFLPKH